MNKSELAAAVAEKAGLEGKQANAAVDAVIETKANSLRPSPKELVLRGNRQTLPSMPSSTPCKPA